MSEIFPWIFHFFRSSDPLRSSKSYTFRLESTRLHPSQECCGDARHYASEIASKAEGGGHGEDMYLPSLKPVFTIGVSTITMGFAMEPKRRISPGREI